MAGPAFPRPRAIAGLAAPALAVAALLACAAAGLGRATALRAGWPPEAELPDLPAPALLRALALGHPALVADLLTARANLAFGAHLGRPGGVPLLERYLTTAAELDAGPRDRTLRGAAMLVYGGGDISAGGVLAADRLLARGAAARPGDWELLFQLGFNQLFELPRLSDAGDPRRPAWRRAGVEALARAARLDGAPAWLPGLAAQLIAADGDRAAAVALLAEVGARARDPATRAAMARRLAALRAPEAPP